NDSKTRSLRGRECWDRNASGAARTETGVIGSPSSLSEAETADSSHAAPRPREVRNGRPAGIPSAAIGRQFEQWRGLAELHGFAPEPDADRPQRRIGGKIDHLPAAGAAAPSPLPPRPPSRRAGAARRSLTPPAVVPVDRSSRQ